MITRKIYTVAGALLGVVSAAYAQDDVVKPPIDGIGVAPLDGSMPWIAILCTLVFVAGVAVVGFKNARRTHLD